MTIHRTKSSYHGFTLIELLIVIIIMGILATIGITAFANAQKKGRDSKRKTDIAQIQRALEAYINDYGTYPKSDTEGRILGCGSGEEACVWGSAFANTSNGTVYLASLPKDTKGGYAYEFIEPNGYRIYSRLENTNDIEVVKQADGSAGQYEETCGTTYCNYVVTSDTVSGPAAYTPCSVTGVQCITGSSCCSGYCCGGKCSSGPCCLANNTTCGSDSQCCGGHCCGGKCSSSTCCLANNTPSCTTNAQCCNNSCKGFYRDTDKNGYGDAPCTPSSFCATTPPTGYATTCCKASGTLGCTMGGNECCNACAGFYKNVTCAWYSMCAANSNTPPSGYSLKRPGESCSTNSECCNNSCKGFYRDTDNNGYGDAPCTLSSFCATTPPTGYATTCCKASGPESTCTSNNECCSGNCKNGKCAEICLAFHWAMEETGTTVTDSSGNGVSGTVYNAPGPTTGKIGSARLFTLSGKQKIHSPSYPMATNEPFAVSAWVKPTEDNTGSGYDSHGIVGHGWQDPGGHGWFLNAGGLGFYSGGTNVPGCWSGDADGTPVGVSARMAFPLNQWYHIGMSYDGATITCYINGNLIGTIRANIPGSNVPIVVSSIWYNYDHYYTGAVIDEVKFWTGKDASKCSTTILKAEILKEYNRGR